MENNQDLGNWHFSHLGEEYFKRIGSITLEKYSLDIPIKTVFVGKTGEPYYLKNKGREVNPNWCVIMENGEEKKYDGRKRKLNPGLYNTGHCFRFEWEEIKNFFNSKK